MTAGPCVSLANIGLIIHDERNDPPRRSEAEPHWLADLLILVEFSCEAARIPRTELAEVRRQFARMLDEGVSAKSIMVALHLSRTMLLRVEDGLSGARIGRLEGSSTSRSCAEIDRSAEQPVARVAGRS